MAKRKIYLKKVKGQPGSCCMNCYFYTEHTLNCSSGKRECSNYYYYKLIKIEEVE